MGTVTLILMLCQSPTIVNNTDREITPYDMKVLKRATTVCADRYNKCVKEFRIEKGNHYNVICGATRGLTLNKGGKHDR